MIAQQILIVINLFLLESMLSLDNAAVLAIMVRDLPKQQQPRALKYGLLGAFALRGAALLVAAWLVHILWLKILGGAYLVYLTYGHFTPKKDTLEEGIDKEHNKLFLRLKNHIGLFWSTVILVEFCDMAFSLDNVFACVAFTSNIYLIWAGVFMGMIAMRFVAQWFSYLIGRFPTLENSAFVVIGLLGLKLIVSGWLDYTSAFDSARRIMETHAFDLWFSGGMMTIFFGPMLFRKKRIYGRA